MNMALVFVQIARHLYQVMTPKVIILTKEKDTYMGSGRETGWGTKKCVVGVFGHRSAEL